MQNDELERLEKIKWDLLAEEGITKEDVELVNLSIGFSPVIPVCGDKAYEVMKTIGGNYIIFDHPIIRNSISPEDLRVMRYRYLTSK